MNQPAAAPLTVGIAGGSSSGKTTVVERIIERLPIDAVASLEMDAYYRDLSGLAFEERVHFNFDHPDAFDMPLLLGHIEELIAGRPIEKPVYSFAEHTREGRVEIVRPAEIIIVEGIMVLASQELRARMQVKIYVDTDDDIRLIRRLVRDIRQRGRSFENVLEQYQTSVRPMHLAFVEPSRRYADIIVPRGGRNEVAIGMIAETIRARLALARPAGESGPVVPPGPPEAGPSSPEDGQKPRL